MPFLICSAVASAGISLRNQNSRDRLAGRIEELDRRLAEQLLDGVAQLLGRRRLGGLDGVLALLGGRERQQAEERQTTGASAIGHGEDLR